MKEVVWSDEERVEKWKWNKTPLQNFNHELKIHGKNKKRY